MAHKHLFQKCRSSAATTCTLAGKSSCHDVHPHSHTGTNISLWKWRKHVYVPRIIKHLWPEQTCWTCTSVFLLWRQHVSCIVWGYPIIHGGTVCVCACADFFHATFSQLGFTHLSDLFGPDTRKDGASQ